MLAIISLRTCCVAGSLAAIVIGGCGGADDTTSTETSAQTGQPSFSDPTTIDNPYYPLTESRTCRLEGIENGDAIRITRKVLAGTEPFDVAGATVEAVVVEDREYENGEIVERVLDYFAQGDDGAVYYLGKDVDNYERGVVAGHEGTFRYGRDTEILGVVMPADPQPGDSWRVEVVDGATARRASVVGRAAQLEARGRVHAEAIRVAEVEPPSREVEFKFYARDAGLVRELPPGGRVELIRCI